MYINLYKIEEFNEAKRLVEKKIYEIIKELRLKYVILYLKKYKMKSKNKCWVNTTTKRLSFIKYLGFNL